MKFYCDACNTKYAISDDKVRGKVLKVRCKHCGNVITVREMANTLGGASSAARSTEKSSPKRASKRPPPPIPPAPPKAPPKVPQKNWHFALNGVTQGPFQLGELKSKYATGEIGDETYVWHDTFDSWKPVATVEIFQAELRQGAALKPRFQTMGYTGPIEAVKANANPSSQTAGVVPQRVASEARNEPQKRTPEAKPRNVLDSLKSQPTAKGKLDRLRKRLEQESEVETSEPVAQTSSDPIGSLSDLGAGVGLEPAQSSSARVVSEPQNDPLSFFPNEVDVQTPEATPEVYESPFASLKEQSASAPVEAETSDLIGDAIGGLVKDARAENSGVGMFPTTPELGTERSASQQVSGSLLIQLDSIKKTGRKKRVFFGIAIFALLGIVATAAVAAYIFSDKEEIEVAVETPEERELVIRKYSKDQNKKFSNLDLSEEVVPEIGTAELAALVKEDEKIEEDERDGKSVEKSETAKTKVKKTAEKKSTEKTTVSKTSKKPTDILAPRATINRPKDKLVQKGTTVGLSREAAQRGFRKVSHAVSICRERHQSRSGRPLKSAKVKLTVTVKPNGRVQAYSISPKELENTAFDSCMKSKKDTWRFAKFSGPAVKINRTFVLQ